MANTRIDPAILEFLCVTHFNPNTMQTGLFLPVEIAILIVQFILQQRVMNIIKNDLPYKLINIKIELIPFQRVSFCGEFLESILFEYSDILFSDAFAVYAKNINVHQTEEGKRTSLEISINFYFQIYKDHLYEKLKEMYQDVQNGTLEMTAKIKKLMMTWLVIRTKQDIDEREDPKFINELSSEIKYDGRYADGNDQPGFTFLNYYKWAIIAAHNKTKFNDGAAIIFFLKNGLMHSLTSNRPSIFSNHITIYPSIFLGNIKKLKKIYPKYTTISNLQLSHFDCNHQEITQVFEKGFFYQSTFIGTKMQAKNSFFIEANLFRAEISFNNYDTNSFINSNLDNCFLGVHFGDPEAEVCSDGRRDYWNEFVQNQRNWDGFKINLEGSFDDIVKYNKTDGALESLLTFLPQKRQHTHQEVNYMFNNLCLIMIARANLAINDVAYSKSEKRNFIKKRFIYIKFLKQIKMNFQAPIDTIFKAFKKESFSNTEWTYNMFGYRQGKIDVDLDVFFILTEGYLPEKNLEEKNLSCNQLIKNTLRLGFSYFQSERNVGKTEAEFKENRQYKSDMEYLEMVIEKALSYTKDPLFLPAVKQTMH